MRKYLASAVALLLVSCGGDGEPAVSTDPTERFLGKLNAAEWSGEPSGVIKEIGGQPHTLAEDLVVLEAEVVVWNKTPEEQDFLGEFSLFAADGTKIHELRVEEKVVHGFLETSEFPLQPRGAQRFHCRGLMSLSRLQKLKEPFRIGHGHGLWSWQLPELPSHDEMFADKTCFHSFAARIRSQEWLGWRAHKEIQLKRGGGGGKGALKHDMAGIELSLEIRNLTKRAIRQRQFIGVFSKSERPQSDGDVDSVTVWPWKRPLARLVLHKPGESPEPIPEWLEIPAGGTLVLELESSMARYSKLARESPLAVRDMICGWEVPLDPLPSPEELFGPVERAPEEALNASVKAQEWRTMPAGTSVAFEGEKRALANDLAALRATIEIRNETDRAQPIPMRFVLADRSGREIEGFGVYADSEQRESLEPSIELRPRESRTLHLESVFQRIDELKLAQPLFVTHRDYTWRWEAVPLPDDSKK